jgi:hypothetical protein
MTRKQLIRIGFWSVLGVAVVLLILAITDGGDDDSGSDATTSAEIVSVDELREIAAEEDEPVYWAGDQAGAELELSRPTQGRTYVRYLTDGAEAGDPNPEFLTVGTYAFPDAAETLEEQGREPGGVLASAPGGGVVYFSRTQPENVYLAYPGEDVQIEVYDPDAKRAIELASSGQIVPIG